MSSKHRRLRPRSGYQRPYGSSPPSGGGGRKAGGGKFFFGVAVLFAACAIVYAVTRPKTPAAAANTKPTPGQPTPAAKPPPTQGPRVDYNRTYDFGRAPGDLPVDATFVLTNTGNAMLEISDVRPGCGCMKTNEWTRHIPPGKTGTIPIRLDTKMYTGNFAKSIFVTCNDPAQTNLMLELRGYIYRPLEITPPTAALVLSVNSETSSNQAALQLTNKMDGPLWISDPRSTLPNVQLELQTNQPGKAYQLMARTVPPLPTATQMGQITLATSLPDMPTTNLTLRIDYQPVVQAVPYLLRLPAYPLTNAASVTAYARNGGTNAMTIKEAAVNAPNIPVEIKDDPLNRAIAVTANFPVGFSAPAGTSLELTIQTTHPLHPTLKVPIIEVR